MDYEMKTKFINPTAGLNGITFDSKKHLVQYFSYQNLQFIEDLVLKLKRVYSTINYDPMYLFSIILNAALKLRLEINNFSPQKLETSNEKMPKESILLSAETRMNSFVDWPEIFRRRTRDELERSVIKVKSKIYQPKEADKEISKVVEFREEQEEFKIRIVDTNFKKDFDKEQAIDEIKKKTDFGKQLINIEMRALKFAFEQLKKQDSGGD